MASIPEKVAQRISAGIKKFQPILEAAKARDANEFDTVIIVTDLLHEVFGTTAARKLQQDFFWS